MDNSWRWKNTNVCCKKVQDPTWRNSREGVFESDGSHLSQWSLNCAEVPGVILKYADEIVEANMYFRDAEAPH